MSSWSQYSINRREGLCPLRKSHQGPRSQGTAAEEVEVLIGSLNSWVENKYKHESAISDNLSGMEAILCRFLTEYTMHLGNDTRDEVPLKLD